MVFTPVTGLIVAVRHFLLCESVFTVITNIHGKWQESNGEIVDGGVFATRIVAALDHSSAARIALAQLKNDADFMATLDHPPLTITKETSEIWNARWTLAWRAPRGGTYYRADPTLIDEDA